jgi:Polyketide cyclase / dehydrase and lipid transport
MHGMKPIIVTETVQASIDRLFAVASDIPNCADYINGIETIETLSEAPPAENNLGPVGEGYAWREERIMFGKKATEDMTITDWSPPNSYKVEARSHGCHYLTEITFKPLPDVDGKPVSTMTMSFGATPETFGAKIMMFMFSFMTKKLIKCLEEDLHDIKTVAESD